MRIIITILMAMAFFLGAVTASEGSYKHPNPTTSWAKPPMVHDYSGIAEVQQAALIWQGWLGPKYRNTYQAHAPQPCAKLKKKKGAIIICQDERANTAVAKVKSLNGDIAWVRIIMGRYEGTNVQLSLALHELGHAYGLEDSNDPTALMYIRASTTLTLNKQDRWQLRQIEKGNVHGQSRLRGSAPRAKHG